jgi:hypothetical protein
LLLCFVTGEMAPAFLSRASEAHSICAHGCQNVCCCTNGNGNACEANRNRPDDGVNMFSCAPKQPPALSQQSSPDRHLPLIDLETASLILVGIVPSKNVRIPTSLSRRPPYPPPRMA